MNNSEMLKHIASASPAFRVGLANLCKLHSEKECNGEYYFDDDLNAWIGYDGNTHSQSNTQAKEGKRREAEILRKLERLTGQKTLPAFISYSGDPRGFVLKINSDKLTEQEIKLAHELDFMRDWGGDFAIIKDSEWV